VPYCQKYAPKDFFGDFAHWVPKKSIIETGTTTPLSDQNNNNLTLVFSLHVGLLCKYHVWV